MNEFEKGMIISQMSADVKYEITDVNGPDNDELKIKVIGSDEEAWIPAPLLKKYIDEGKGFLIKELPSNRLNDVE